MLIVAERAIAEPFAVAVYWIDPLPVPEEPDVMVSQAASLAAVHAHPGGAATFTEPDAAAEAIDWEAGDTAMLQRLDAAA